MTDETKRVLDALEAIAGRTVLIHDDYDRGYQGAMDDVLHAILELRLKYALGVHNAEVNAAAAHL